MPLFAGLLWGALAGILESLIGRVLVSLAISYVTYQGVDLLLGSLKTAAFSYLVFVPPDFLGFIGLARIGESISVVCSALTAKFVLQGMTGGSLTKIGIKK